MRCTSARDRRSTRRFTADAASRHFSLPREIAWTALTLRNARLGGEPGAACLRVSAGNTRRYLVICCGSAVATRRGYGPAVFSQVGWVSQGCLG
jgi:hypothetical protein